MSGINLADYERRAVQAVSTFWRTRGKARAKQATGVDVGERSAVTAGKNMDGFIDLVKAVVLENGLAEEVVFSARGQSAKQRHTTLPGYYRPVKDWDFLVVHRGVLVAVLEFKSHVGPSFGNTFNNRCEEALGMGEDLRVAFREGQLGSPPRPFVGYLMLLEDAEASQRPVSNKSDHFSLDPVFDDASYAARYDILCRRLMGEGLYDAAALLLSSAEQGPDGVYREVSKETGLRRFISGLAARVAQRVVDSSAE